MTSGANQGHRILLAYMRPELLKDCAHGIVQACDLGAY